MHGLKAISTSCLHRKKWEGQCAVLLHVKAQRGHSASFRTCCSLDASLQDLLSKQSHTLTAVHGHLQLQPQAGHWTHSWALGFSAARGLTVVVGQE